MTPRLEVYEIPARRGNAAGFRFRMVTDDEAEAYVSAGLYDTADTAERVAYDVNRIMFCGEFEVTR